jgi:hypothetical protein
MFPSRSCRSALPARAFFLVIMMILVETRDGRAQAPFLSGGQTLQSAPIVKSTPPEEPQRTREVLAMQGEFETALAQLRNPQLSAEERQRLEDQIRRLNAALAAPAPGFPVRITDLQGYARGAVVVDSTRLDPNALGLFLPSAIPVKGEPFYGLGERATVQGQGSSVGFNWLADVGGASVTGAAKAQVQTTQSGELTVTAPQAFLQWKDMLFGLTDSAFTDMYAIPDTIDLAGPNARTWLKNGQPQLRYTISPTNAATNPTGFYEMLSVEMPGADVYLPSTPPGAPIYTTFSRYPDFVASFDCRHGEFVENPCTHNKNVYSEFWHLKWGSVFRDLGVERADNTVRDTAFGWGTQLSGQYTVFRSACGGLRDFLYFSATYGNGVSHYINDLHLVSAVNDAAFDRVNGIVTPLPVFAYYGAVTHEWGEKLRSTAVYSHVDLNSEQIPGGSTTTLPYRRGETISINLMYHSEPCVDDSSKTKKIEHHFVAGLEYLFGQKENLGGAFGADHRVMFMVGAAN